MSLWCDFFAAAVMAGTPLLLATLGEILHERAGHLNLGVEGMMSLGAIGGFLVGYYTNNFIAALIVAFLAGALGALIYAVLTVTFMANQNVTGLTLTIFCVGVSNLIGFHFISISETGTLKLPAGITKQMRGVPLTRLSTMPVLGKLFFSYSPFVYLGIVIAVIMSYYMFHTNAGRNLRAIGESPAAADAAGIKVIQQKYIHIVIGGGICGIGGAYTSMITNGGVWIDNCVGGLGWIALALVIFAAWKPMNAVVGSFLFGAFRILKYYVNKDIISIPNAFYDMLPFVITALVLIVASVRQSKENAQPASCGTNYYREER